jgi:hypothetical protein
MLISRLNLKATLIMPTMLDFGFSRSISKYQYVAVMYNDARDSLGDRFYVRSESERSSWLSMTFDSLLKAVVHIIAKAL